MCVYLNLVSKSIIAHLFIILVFLYKSYIKILILARVFEILRAHVKILFSNSIIAHLFIFLEFLYTQQIKNLILARGFDFVRAKIEF